MIICLRRRKRHEVPTARSREKGIPSAAWDVPRADIEMLFFNILGRAFEAESEDWLDWPAKLIGEHQIQFRDTETGRWISQSIDTRKVSNE
jgi:hypothetical protein